MNFLHRLWPGRPDTSAPAPIVSNVSDADIDVVETATSYVLKGERVPVDVLADLKQLPSRPTGFFLGDALIIKPRNGEPHK